MKKGKQLVIITLLLCLIGLTACGNGESERGFFEQLPNGYGAASPTPAADIKYFGSKETGFVEVPKAFIDFKEEGSSDPDMFQACDSSGKTIVTFKPFHVKGTPKATESPALDFLIKNKSADSKIANDSVMTLFTADLLARLTSNGPSVTMVETEMSGMPAYQIKSFYSDGTALQIYIIDCGEEGKFNYLAVESPDSDLGNAIAEAYKFSKN